MVCAKRSMMSLEREATAHATTRETPQVDEQMTEGSLPDTESLSELAALSTATTATALLKHGLRKIWIHSATPLDDHYGRLVGPAFTLRFVPGREDLATPDALAASDSTRAAVEAMPAGVVAVVDAMGVDHVGIVGDILCARMKV